MKILALGAALGYGYTKEGLLRAFEQEIDYVGIDGGSTDPGPYYLGSGKIMFTKEAIKDHLKLALPMAAERKIPLIVGTSGGSGSEAHLSQLRDIINELAAEHGLTLKVALIHTEVSKEYVLDKFRNDKVISFTDQLQLTEESIMNSATFVSQIGVDEFIEALDEGVDVILAGRACDTAIYASPAIRAGYKPGLAFHMAKIMECGSMCSYPMTAADVIVGDIQEDHFVLEPGNPIRKCTVDRVAAHTLYEQSTPFFITEPHGKADLRESVYEQISDRAVKVSNSKFIPTEKKTLKIEGSMLVGYRTICIGGANEPEMIRRIKEIEEAVTKLIHKDLSEVLDKEDYSLTFRKYGGTKEGFTIDEADCGMGVLIDAIGKTQEIANYVCAVARGKLLHYDYPGRKTTAGNIAFPFSPSDIPVGPVYNFSAYHLVEVDDFCETSNIEYVKVGVDCE